MDEETKKLINFLAETFAHRDAAMQAHILALENSNLQLAQQVSWYRGAMSGGVAPIPGTVTSEIQ